MGFFSDKCQECGAKVRRKASFCPGCGKSAPRAKIVCPVCHTEMKATTKFCGQCGNPVSAGDADETAPVDVLNRWQRADDEFARRVEASDLRAVLNSGLVVEWGTRALIFQGGKLAVVASEGTYNLNQPMQHVDTAQPATAILMDAGDTRLPLLYRDVRTQEEVPVDVTVELVVHLSDPAALYANIMHGRDSLSVSELAELLWSESANVVQARVRQSSVKELDGNLEMKTTLENDLREHISAALARNGLELVLLRFVSFASEEYEKVRDRAAETFIAEEKADDSQRRAVLNRKLRETLTQDRMHQFTSAKDFEEFVRQTEHDLQMKGVIRKEEMAELLRTYEEKKEDAEIARKHLLAKLELEEKLELMQRQHSLNDEQFRHTRQQEQQRLDTELEDDWKRFTRGRDKRDAGRADRRKDVDAKADEVRTKMGLAADAVELRGKKATQQDEEESQRIAREQEEMDREAARVLEAKDRESKRELDKIKTLSEAEQARLAADLQKTEVLKDMSEDQILALMAKDSPEVAAAIGERARAQAEAGATEEVKALYEKILAGKDAETDRIERVMDKAMQSMERVAGAATAQQREQKDEIKDVMNRGMDRMADVAVAKAGASGGTGSSSTADVVCPSCQRQAPAGSKFCDNCGHQFFK